MMYFLTKESCIFSTTNRDVDYILITCADNTDDDDKQEDDAFLAEHGAQTCQKTVLPFSSKHFPASFLGRYRFPLFYTT